MNKKLFCLLAEIKIWLSGRFTLTAEEKFWLLLVLTIFWVGLVARHFYLEQQSPEPLSPEKVEALLHP